MALERIILRDSSAALVDAWRAAFADARDVEVGCGDIFDIEADALVSPANSFGFMDGGIDGVYSRRLGWHIQERLRARLREQYDGECPVGWAVEVATDDARYPWVISAPTMRAPGTVAHTENAYLAFRATLRLVARLNASGQGPIASVLCPGLATATGGMSPRLCARQMRQAYDEVVLGRDPGIASVNDAINHKYRMLREDAPL